MIVFHFSKQDAIIQPKKGKISLHYYYAIQK